MKKQARWYQIESINSVQEAFKGGHKRVILCLPTGAGKTFTFSIIGQMASQKGKKVLYLTHRERLHEQISEAVSDAISVTASTPKNAFFGGICQMVAMVETFHKRDIDFKPDLIIIDEAHRAEFTKVIARFPDTYIIGATATPTGKHIPKIYTKIVQVVGIDDLIKEGFLCSYSAVEVQLDTSILEKKRGDYTEASQYTAFSNRALFSDTLERWEKRYKNLKTIIFNINIQHVEKVYDEWKSKGYRCGVVHSKKSKVDNDLTLRAFETGQIQVLSTCDMMTTGIDIPSIECVVLNRKIGELHLFLQMIGRGGRITPEKSHFYVLDMGMNHTEHLTWDHPRQWTLENKEKKQGAAPIRICPKCDGVNHAAATECKVCGYAFPKKDKDIGDGVEVEVKKTLTPEPLVGRRLKELSGEELFQLEQSGRYAPKFIWRVARTLGGSVLTQYADLKGYKQGWISRQMTLQKGVNDFRLR